MAVVDQFPGREATENDPPNRWITGTPSDDDDLPFLSQQIRAHTAGTITVMAYDKDGTLSAMRFDPGETRLIKCRRVMSTGTTLGIVYEVGFVVPRDFE